MRITLRDEVQMLVRHGSSYGSGVSQSNHVNRISGRRPSWWIMASRTPSPDKLDTVFGSIEILQFS